MLYLGADDRPVGRDKARELLSQDPKLVRHTKAWVDDSQLCLEVECRLRDGSLVPFRMCYCWDAPPFRGHNYFMDITGWLLNNNWLSFYEFVQARFVDVLKEHATKEYDS
jgi:hypothetical protein